MLYHSITELFFPGIGCLDSVAGNLGSNLKEEEAHLAECLAVKSSVVCVQFPERCVNAQTVAAPPAVTHLYYPRFPTGDILVTKESWLGFFPFSKASFPDWQAQGFVLLLSLLLFVGFQ